MKKHHILLILVIAGIAAFLLKEARDLESSESGIRTELAILRDAVKRSHATDRSTATPSGSPGTRSPAIDPRALMADLKDILEAGPTDETMERMSRLMEGYEKQLASAPLSKLKEICELLEADFPLDQEAMEPARRIWLGIVGMASRSDPAWAFAKLDQAASAIKVPMADVLECFKRWPSQDGGAMSLSYATALQEWLDAAQAGGRIEPDNPLAAELRAEIASARGDQSAAIKHISQLPARSRREAAIEHVKGLQTPEARRQALEELGTVLDADGFAPLVGSLTDQHGFDAAREILASASLAPEKHDLAAASIAAAKPGPETRDRAAWLLENLRSDDPRPLEKFAGSWTEANHADAASWIASLPQGPQRDAALKGFIPAAARIDGASAMDWALTVSDPLLRNRLYGEAHQKWAETDAERAKEYRDSHPLDPEALKAASE